MLCRSLPVVKVPKGCQSKVCYCHGGELWLLLRVQIHSQAVHLVQVLPSGRLVKVQQLGKHRWDDDELILSEQADAEERWRSSQVCLC